VGLEGLTSRKWVVLGSGQVRGWTSHPFSRALGRLAAGPRGLQCSGAHAGPPPSVPGAGAIRGWTVHVTLHAERFRRCPARAPEHWSPRRVPPGPLRHI